MLNNFNFQESETWVDISTVKEDSILGFGIKRDLQFLLHFVCLYLFFFQLFAYLAFAVSVIWIYTTATEIVNLLKVQYVSQYSFSTDLQQSRRMTTPTKTRLKNYICVL